ncbi:MAG: sulfotransferase family protein [Pseudonocardiales bacterium]|nr:MAG: sulfotransferase family protein [Pseudonocardiales bacterium]
MTGRAKKRAGSPRTTVLFVGGMPRSGSTLFDLMVGQLPAHCDVGELFYLWQAGPLRDQLCACGLAFTACPFWPRVGKEAFGGWDQIDVQEMLDLQRRVDTTARLPLALLGGLLPGHARRVRRYLAVLGDLYAAIASVSGAAVVVDSTKRPSTAHLLARAPLVDLKVVQVVRDPRGVVNSWSREVPLPEGAGARAYLKARPLRQIVRRWVTVNLMTEALAARRVPLLRVRYEHLVRQPVEEMTRVLRLVGIQPSEEATSFLGPDGLATGRSHAVAGGRVRMISGTLPLTLDEKWRRELPGWKQWVTVAVTWPLMRRYGYR